MTLYSNTLASHSYRFKRLMLTYRNTEIEQLLRDARLLFERLDKVLESPNDDTEAYRLKIEKLVESFAQHQDISLLKTELQSQYSKLNNLL